MIHLYQFVCIHFKCFHCGVASKLSQIEQLIITAETMVFNITDYYLSLVFNQKDSVKK